MKTIIEYLKELGKSVLAGICMLMMFVAPLFIVVKYEQWQKKMESYRQTAHQEVKRYISTDGGYHTKLEITTLAYGNGKVITTKSLRLIPSKSNVFFADSTGLEDIVLWDYDNDGKWDKMFLSGYPNNTYGANAIVFNGQIEDWKSWGWSPCPAEEKTMKPFDACTIQHALSLLKELPG